ncbi:MAG: CaiB/BaiF CoA transferase family protein, partial [Halomonas sp.]
MMASSSRQTGSLSGIRVIDLTRVISGPFCTQILGDHGADVVKVEPPGKGDVVRRQGNMVNGESWYFAQFNRNKRSLTLDLRSEEGKAILHRLLEGADVLVENFRPGTLERWGLSWGVLHQANPGLILLRVTGFGQKGPYASRPAFGTLVEAMSGFAYMTGHPE